MEAPAPPAVTASGWTGRHAVELYVRTYSTMLQSSGEIKLDSLVHAHLGMGSALHPLAAEPQVDMGALIYSVRRLPLAIARSRRVFLGSSPHGFKAAVGADIASWERVKAPARRRPWYYDRADTLAVLLASPSDIDDLVPTLVAFQIEWNKLHDAVKELDGSSEAMRRAAGATEADWARLIDSFGPEWERTLAAVSMSECHITLRLIGGSHIGYARSAGRWWIPVQAAIDELGLSDAPFYFVSSNVHSLVNVLSGVARRFEANIVDHVSRADPDLQSELEKLESGETMASRDNWLYFGARVLFDGHEESQKLRRKRQEMEAEVGIRHVAPRDAGIDSAAQIVRVSDLDPDAFIELEDGWPVRRADGKIPDDELSRSDLPADDAPEDAYHRFALTTDGYERMGSFERCGELANRALERWTEGRELPTDLRDLRCCLFFEQRRWHHHGYGFDEEAFEYVRALVGAMRSTVEPR